MREKSLLLVSEVPTVSVLSPYCSRLKKGFRKITLLAEEDAKKERWKTDETKYITYKTFLPGLEPNIIIHSCAIIYANSNKKATIILYYQVSAFQWDKAI